MPIPDRRAATGPSNAALPSPLDVQTSSPWDVLVLGAGAAGLATAIFTRAGNPRRSVLLLDGARKIGAKILVSGGGRCNVTNRIVTERDYWGGPTSIVRRILRAYSADDAVTFFRDAGVSLHEESDGKLFPDSNRARDVLEALQRRASETGVVLRTGERVRAIDRRGDLFVAATSGGPISARTVVIATGGQSLPKTGSDGAGYAIVRSLGHTIVPTTPGLAPLVLSSESMHAEIAGVSLEAGLTVWADRAASVRLRGSLLWTHFGISGPVALNASRHWLRARLEGRSAGLTANFVPDRDFAGIETFWLAQSGARPRSSVGSLLGELLPASMAQTLLNRLAIDSSTPLAAFQRDDRRRLGHALTEWPLDVQDSRGYSYAEVTAGGVDLREIDPATMESRVCPGMFLVGEILDVDGRLGGFNFQWAWSTAHVAATRLARQTA